MVGGRLNVQTRAGIILHGLVPNEAAVLLPEPFDDATGIRLPEDVVPTVTIIVAGTCNLPRVRDLESGAGVPLEPAAGLAEPLGQRAARVTPKQIRKAVSVEIRN